jgi:formylmethanofuran dehydrogenase subunit C
MIARVTRRLATAMAVALLAITTVACDIVTADLRSEESTTWQKSYPLDGSGRLEISNVNGKIRVEPSSGNTVEVSATKKARGATPEQAKASLDRASIAETVSAGSVKLETKMARMTGIVLNGGNVQVEYMVKVPAGAEVRLTTVNGGIEVAGMTGRVFAETTNGGVETRGLTGQLEASTTNGGLDIEMAAIPEGGVKLECTNGGIKVRLPRDGKATISASVANGGISPGDLPIDITGENTRRRLEGRLNGGGPRVQIEGTNGGITLTSR